MLNFLFFFGLALCIKWRTNARNFLSNRLMFIRIMASIRQTTSNGIILMEWLIKRREYWTTITHSMDDRREKKPKKKKIYSNVLTESWLNALCTIYFRYFLSSHRDKLSVNDDFDPHPIKFRWLCSGWFIFTVGENHVIPFIKFLLLWLPLLFSSRIHTFSAFWHGKTHMKCLLLNTNCAKSYWPKKTKKAKKTTKSGFHLR